MARPLTLTEIRQALSRWRVPHVVTDGAAARKNSGTWGDITGCMMHHTASDAPDAANRDLLIRGRAGLPGPLANFGVRDDGVVDIIAAGPANHAGGGDPAVLAAVRAESYTGYPPKTTKAHGQSGAVSGNPVFYGWEVYYGWGGDPDIDAIQYRASILSMAAIVDELDRIDGAAWTARSVIGHKEWQRGKPDPAGVDMRTARADIQWCLDVGPTLARAWYDTGRKTPTPTTHGGPPMSLPTVKHPYRHRPDGTPDRWPMEDAIWSVWVYVLQTHHTLSQLAKTEGLDVDETALAAALLPGLEAAIAAAIADVNPDGVDADAIAARTVAKLSEALGSVTS